MRRNSIIPALIPLLLCLFSAAPAPAQEPSGEPLFDPLFLGYETEPGMDYGGRTLASLQSALSRAIGSIGSVGERHPGAVPAWEFPLAAAMLLVQHEVGGHGGRAREFGLGPSYAFSYDFSASTGTERSPESNEQLMLLAAGGTEADGILARRVLLDALGPEGVDGAKIPLALMAKVDLSLYISTVSRPEPGDGEDDFTRQSREGNDIAIYLAGRQAERNGIDPQRIWFGSYDPDFDDPLLEENWRDARVTALWNLLDPVLVSAAYAYFRDHVLGGDSRVRLPVLRLANGAGLTLGTRGALGPGSASRFLDLHAATRQGILTVYLRDLDSSTDRTYGAGAAIRGLKLAQSLELGLSADTWKEPEAEEGLYDGRNWNLTGEVETRFGRRWGASAKLGIKGEGFLPGLPVDEGAYAGLGLRAVW